jgi:hypothetical protein
VQEVGRGRGGVGQPEMGGRLEQGWGGGKGSVIRGGDVEPLQKSRCAGVGQMRRGLQAQEHDDLATTSRGYAVARFEAVDDDDLGQEGIEGPEPYACRGGRAGESCSSIKVLPGKLN